MCFFRFLSRVLESSAYLSGLGVVVAGRRLQGFGRWCEDSELLDCAVKICEMRDVQL